MESQNETINHWMIKPKCSGNTPESLYADAQEYFMWCEKNPIYKQEMIKQTGAVVNVTYPRAFNLPALCIHCGVTMTYIMEIAQNPQAGDFHSVGQWILQCIYSQNLEYAMVGIFSSPVTIKKLNLGAPDQVNNVPAVVHINVIKPKDELQLAETEFDEKGKEQFAKIQ